MTNYKECSGNPEDCPENEGYGCCYNSLKNAISSALVFRYKEKDANTCVDFLLSNIIAPYYEKRIAELKAQIPDWKFINENLIKLINETDIGTANAIAAYIYDTTPAE